MTIRLLIAEDHDLVREGLRITFEESEIEVVGEAKSGSDAIRFASLQWRGCDAAGHQDAGGRRV